MWKSIKTWILDHEKLMLIPYGIAIPMVYLFPQYLFQIPLTLFFGYKIFDIATDKSTNSTVKEIRSLLGEKVAATTTGSITPQSSPPATPAV